MNIRKCDNYITCEECDCYTKYTEKIKQVMHEVGYEKINKILRLAQLENYLTPFKDNTRWETMVRINDEGNEEEFSFPAATKEQVCIKHYYDKNRMYSNATYYKSEEECCDLCKYVYENKDNVLGYSCKNKGDFPINPYCVCDEFIER